MRIPLLAAALTLSCASTPPPPVSAWGTAPPLDTELHDTRWWLKFHEGLEDGRIIHVVRSGGEYLCTLVNPGKVLATIRGYKTGETYCRLRKVGPGKYEGTYLTRFLDGTERWRAVTFSTYGGVMRWSEAESEHWEKLP